LTNLPETPLLSVEFVRHCVAALAAAGYRTVRTAALSPLEQSGFLAAGFTVEEDLRLLRMDLTRDLPRPPAGVRLVGVRRRRRREVLVVDRAAFSDFWRFDDLALEDALHATPEVRFRASARRLGPIEGYAISGRAGRRGYVQRLAVHPDHQGRGLGRRLLLDGLTWMVSLAVTRAFVNTQAGNQAALALYKGVGFEEEATGLSVLSAQLT
jgi:ribosomal protein S18 acetylase RimI-like enzyme